MLGGYPSSFSKPRKKFQKCLVGIHQPFFYAKSDIPKMPDGDPTDLSNGKMTFQKFLVGIHQLFLCEKCLSKNAKDSNSRDRVQI